MPKAKLKTQPTKQTVESFVGSIKDERTRKDCEVVMRLMQKATRDKGKMWGSAIAGFGSTHLVYESGRELDWFLIGFSPRKQNLSLYIAAGSPTKKALLQKLGTYTMAKSCLYIKRLSDINLSILEKLIALAVKEARQKSS